VRINSFINAVTAFAMTFAARQTLFERRPKPLR
jgi:hypothetical protein